MNLIMNVNNYLTYAPRYTYGTIQIDKSVRQKKKPHDGDGEEKLAKDYGLFTKLIIFY
jgi:hypothetical protein